MRVVLSVEAEVAPESYESTQHSVTERVRDRLLELATDHELGLDQSSVHVQLWRRTETAYGSEWAKFVWTGLRAGLGLLKVVATATATSGR